MNAHASRIEAYLAELDRAMAGLPAARREEIVRDVRAHIESEVADGAATTDAELETLLDGLGSPADIAAAAGETVAGQGNPPFAAFPMQTAAAAPPRPRVGGREVATIVLLLIGGFFFLVGWVVGVVLLWTSTAWRTRDKLIGTLLVPGGFASVLLVGLMSVGPVKACVSPAVEVGPSSAAALQPVQNVCDGGSSTSTILLNIVLVVLLVGGPIFSAIWLGVTANRGPSRRPSRGFLALVRRNPA